MPGFDFAYVFVAPPGWPLLAGLSMATGLVSIGLLVAGRRRLDPWICWRLSAAVLAACVGIHAAQVALVYGIGAEPGVTGPVPLPWPLWRTVLLAIGICGGVSGHFLIHAVGRFVERGRQGLGRAWPAAHGLAVLTALAALAGGYGHYWRFNLGRYRTWKTEQQAQTLADTRAYLDRWIEAEPDDPHPRELRDRLSP